MDIKALHENLLNLNSEIETILKKVNYQNNLCQSDISYDDADADQCMLFDEFYSIFTHFDYIHAVLNYLQLPIKEEGFLTTNDCGKYYINQTEIKCGETIEILLLDLNTGTMRWNIMRLQNQNHDHYLNEPARIRDYNMKKKCF